MTFLQKLFSCLATEIKWGRLVLLAVGAAVTAILLSDGAFNMLALAIFAIAGVFIGRFAPRHPYLNAFCYGLLGVLFYVLLHIFQALGEGPAALTADEVLWFTLSVAIVVVPQALIGTWIGTSVFKFARVAAEARRAAGTTSEQEKAGPAARQSTPPPEKRAGPGPPPRQRKKKKG